MVTDLMVEILEVTGRVSQSNRQDLYHLFSISSFDNHLCSFIECCPGLTNDMVDLRFCRFKYLVNLQVENVPEYA